MKETLLVILRITYSDSLAVSQDLRLLPRLRDLMQPTPVRAHGGFQSC